MQIANVYQHNALLSRTISTILCHEACNYRSDHVVYIDMRFMR